MEEIPRTYLELEEAAEIMGMGRKALLSMIAQGRVESENVEGRTVVVRHSFDSHLHKLQRACQEARCQTGRGRAIGTRGRHVHSWKSRK